MFSSVKSNGEYDAEIGSKCMGIEGSRDKDGEAICLRHFNMKLGVSFSLILVETVGLCLRAWKK